MLLVSIQMGSYWCYWSWNLFGCSSQLSAALSSLLEPDIHIFLFYDHFALKDVGFGLLLAVVALFLCVAAENL